MKSYKIISVTPAGRKRYLEILVPYLLQNRHILSEHHFWLNTKNQEDIDYIVGLGKQYPDFFKINKKEVFEENPLHISLWQYWQDYTDPNTIYVRFDDDVCFVEKDAVKNIVEHRIKNPKPFMIYGNIVNNAISSFIHQNNGVIPKQWKKVGYECMDKIGWECPRFANRLHNRFLTDLKNKRLKKWKYKNWIMKDFGRYSINVVCWFGKDFQGLKELSIKDLREVALTVPQTGEIVDSEESLVSEYLPAKLNRPNEICGNALFGHFAFYTQRKYLENATLLLEKYKLALLPKRKRTHEAQLAIKEFFKNMRYDLKIYLRDRHPGVFEFLKTIKSRLSAEAYS